jgi:hypothetical protein
MSGDIESGLAQSHKSNPWFEAFGARGFASVGAALGLTLSLILVWSTAPPLPAAAAQPKSRPVVQAEKPPSEEVKPSVTAKQALLANPQPLVSAPKAQVSLVASPPSRVVPTTSPRPLPSSPAAERSDSETPSSPPTYGGASESSSGSGGGTVDVRGYYRKNGTYVSPHTRRSPGGRR